MDETLKQKFKALLDYQKKDIELRKLNSVIERDEALALMNKYRRIFNDAKQSMSECDQNAAAILEQYNTLVKYIEENEALLAELENCEVADEELEARVKRLESLKSKFQNAEKKMRDVEEKAKSTCKRRSDALKVGKNAQQQHNEAREKHMALVGSKSAELNKLKAELAAIKAKLDPKLFEEYQALVADNKFPPVVPAAIGDKKDMFNCGGCGLGLPQKGNAMLGDQGWCRCENCRRIIVRM